jgi:two-component system sensor histidine kinase KdpD
MLRSWLALLSMLVLLTIVTAINYNFFSILGITGVTLLSLLVVVVAAYFCEFIIATVIAFLAFLDINYFFTEPRYTFEVAHAQSWASLICFLIVSMVIASLVKQLKFQTLQSSIASSRAQFARTLAENLALATDVNSLLIDTCNLLQAEFSKPIAIAQFEVAQYNTPQQEANKTYNITIKSGLIETPDSRLLNWVSENGKPISPYTDYWTGAITKSKQWLLPFNRLPSKDPILVVDNVNAEENIEIYTSIKSCVDQISQAYQRLINSEKALQAELMAQTEAIQSTLLASISHDMRTPLTSILGAATILQQNITDLEPEQTAQLTSLIASQARYLATSTENILSLIRLESSTSVNIPMDWQSPEEIIGLVTALYKSRDDKSRDEVNDNLALTVSISEPDLLIKANANLLTQALVNLIDNAQQANKAMPNQQHAPILIEVTKTGDKINISVKDTGKGFNTAFDASHIKKFSSSNTKGFGLGLSIVQAIARSHDATLTIANRDDADQTSGACVTLSFQAAQVGVILAE